MKWSTSAAAPPCSSLEALQSVRARRPSTFLKPLWFAQQIALPGKVLSVQASRCSGSRGNPCLASLVFPNVDVACAFELGNNSKIICSQRPSLRCSLEFRRALLFLALRTSSVLHVTSVFVGPNQFVSRWVLPPDGVFWLRTQMWLDRNSCHGRSAGEWNPHRKLPAFLGRAQKGMACFRPALS